VARDKTPGQTLRNASGFTLVELLVVVGLIGILSGLAVGHLLGARVAANEASAIGTLRALNSGQSAFRSTCGSGFFSAAVASLVSGDYLSPDANLSPKSGFTFALNPGLGDVAGPADCTGGATGTTYYFAAAPVSTTTGRRGFATNQNATVWQDVTGAAPNEPFQSSGTVAPIQ
jgi:type IV pilus assembly protein PilA